MSSSQTTGESSDPGNEFLAKLKYPGLLNFLSLIFAVERTYQVLLSPKFMHAWGHFITVCVYLLGFVLGLPALLATGSQAVRRGWSKCLSYICLFAGSVLLLIFLGCDIWAPGK